MSAVEIQIRGPEESMRDSHTLEVGETLRIGRKPATGWEIPWEKRMSREHADVCWDGKGLRLTCLPQARNPAFYHRQPQKEFVASLGEEFAIGKTRFSVARLSSENSGSVAMKIVSGEVLETVFSKLQLSRVAFGNTDRQMETLAALPSMISSSQSDDQLAALLAGLLLQAIPHAEGAAVVRMDPSELGVPDTSSGVVPEAALASVETRNNSSGEFRPSRRLTTKSLREQESIIHIWQGGEGSRNFTATAGLDWAFCAPVPGESCRGWCLYVSGKGAEGEGGLVNDQALQGDLRFTELVAQFIGSVRQVRLLQEHKTQLSTFFSPSVIESVTGLHAEQLLRPAQREITVLFCDIIGFSRRVEQMSHDLLRLLRSVSEVLSIMTNGILERDGTIADFQGDAALGFWGWPRHSDVGPIPACRAALDIHRGFRGGGQNDASLLSGFEVGVGVAHGAAIAGQIGTSKQAKVGVFGPIVNRGARLEGLTRQFGTSICIDEATAGWVTRHMPSSEGRTRRLARVRPKGMLEPLTVYALLPAAAENSESLEAPSGAFEQALDATIQGRWDDARRQLSALPETDGPTQFLLRQMATLGDTVPNDWDGAFPLGSK